MSKVALFIRHKALPGKREEVRQIWETYVQPRVAANPGHEAYFFCYDETDAETVSVFQLYSNREAMTDFLSGEWYQGYLEAIAKVVADPPQILPASVVWQKNTVIGNG